jgi:putative aldouronate transport system substrate-binding protein
MKALKILLAFSLTLSLLSACGGSASPTPTQTPTATPTKEAASSEPAAEASAANADVVDGKFTTTRKITVEVFDRGNDGGTKPENNYYTDFIKAGMLSEHNVEVEFVPVPRWTETEQLNNLLAANDAPDVCVTYSGPTITAYAKMGAVYDLSQAVYDYQDELPNMWEFLGDTYVNWGKDPSTGELFYLMARLFHGTRINTFVREDWLTKLNLSEPTTLEEFESMLYAFQDNAELLLGVDADKLIPYSTSFDIGWRNNYLFHSFVPSTITDQEMFISGYDDRHFLYPGIKEAVRKLNEWYNAGLMWDDFALYGSGDTTEDNMIKSGYVGAFMHNWDYPYRANEAIQTTLQELIGPDAAFVAVDPFANDAGKHVKFNGQASDRMTFFPSTGTELEAALMYVDWLCRFENRNYLQIGDEGVTHQKNADGSVKILTVTGEKIMNSPSNIDYTLIINGLDLGDPEKSTLSLASAYDGITPKYIQDAYDTTLTDVRIGKRYNVGDITAEEGLGEMLANKRNEILANALVAPTDQFDAVFDAGMQDYLNAGGQAIIDERASRLTEFYPEG